METSKPSPASTSRSRAEKSSRSSARTGHVDEFVDFMHRTIAAVEVAPGLVVDM
jgi:hypothetical protein